MLRGAEGALQSLNRFQATDDDAGASGYDLPVLLYSPRPELAAAGAANKHEQAAVTVVELGVAVDPATREVTFPTMQVRERRKQANYLPGREGKKK